MVAICSPSRNRMTTPAARESVRSFSRALNERLTREVTAAGCEKSGFEVITKSGPITVSLEEVEGAYKELCDDHSLEVHRSLMGAAMKLSRFFRHMKFTVHYSSGENEFVTTDVPVIRVFRDQGRDGNGINRPDAEVRFPLSRKAFLTLTHDLGWLAALGRASSGEARRLLGRVPEVRIRRATDLEVEEFNRAHAFHAHRWLFAPADVGWVPAVLSQRRAAPTMVDLSGENVIQLRARPKYDPVAGSPCL
jgi:hypothetical protein